MRKEYKKVSRFWNVCVIISYKIACSFLFELEMLCCVCFERYETKREKEVSCLDFFGKRRGFFFEIDVCSKKCGSFFRLLFVKF